MSPVLAVAVTTTGVPPMPPPRFPPPPPLPLPLPPALALAPPWPACPPSLAASPSADLKWKYATTAMTAAIRAQSHQREDFAPAWPADLFSVMLGGGVLFIVDRENQVMDAAKSCQFHRTAQKLMVSLTDRASQDADLKLTILSGKS